MRWVRMPLMLLRAVWQARRLLEANRPSCAVSFGGYAAAPGGIAAWTKGIPVLVHEQNRIPGMTNRLLTRFARKILQGFPGTFPQEMSAIDSGNPVRHEVAAIAEPQTRLAGRTGPVRVLITGGSQGAQVLNTVVPAALKLLPHPSPSKFVTRLVQSVLMKRLKPMQQRVWMLTYSHLSVIWLRPTHGQTW